MHELYIPPRYISVVYILTQTRNLAVAEVLLAFKIYIYIYIHIYIYIYIYIFIYIYIYIYIYIILTFDIVCRLINVQIMNIPA